jgi:hypothetical protein
VSEPALIAGLAPEVLDQLADALAERLARRLPELATPAEWIDVHEVARRFSLSEATIYTHADELGGRRLGDGPKARLRFHPPTVAKALTSRGQSNGSQGPGSPADAVKSPPARRRRGSSGAQRVPLIPIRGRKE